MKSAVLLFAALLAAPMLAQADLSAELQGKYNRACMACHMAGIAGAPKTGDAEAWAPRLEKGTETLIASIRKGLNALPAGGMCADCSDEEYTALINHMAGVQD